MDTQEELRIIEQLLANSSNNTVVEETTTPEINIEASDTPVSYESTVLPFEPKVDEKEPEQIVDEKYQRFKDSTWFPHVDKLDVLIVGAGGTGSNIAYLLARAGYSLTIYDDDRLEKVNMAGQHYPFKYIGNYKVEALNNVIEDFCQTNIGAVSERYTKESGVSPVMISCLDNMKTREVMFENWVSYLESIDKDSEEFKQAIFIDTRMEAEFFQIFCVYPKDILDYRKTLFDDGDVEEPVCSYKQTSHIGAILGGLVTNYLNIHINNIYSTKLIDLKFRTEYVGTLNMFLYE